MYARETDWFVEVVESGLMVMILGWVWLWPLALRGSWARGSRLGLAWIGWVGCWCWILLDLRVRYI